jgi:hypothetical protein
VGECRKEFEEREREEERKKERKEKKRITQRRRGRGVNAEEGRKKGWSEE